MFIPIFRKVRWGGINNENWWVAGEVGTLAEFLCRKEWRTASTAANYFEDRQHEMERETHGL